MILPSSTLNVVSFSLAFQPVRSLPLKREMKPSSDLSWVELSNSRAPSSSVFTDFSLFQFHQPDVAVRDGIAVVLKVQRSGGVVRAVVRSRRRVLLQFDVLVDLHPVVQHR